MQPAYIFLRRTGILLLLFIFIESFQAQKKQKGISHAVQKAAPGMTYKIIPGAGNTFGYDVYVNDRLQVHQPMIPALSGNKGFATRTAAEKVARLVIEKIRKGEMPPTVSREEMKRLKVI